MMTTIFLAAFLVSIELCETFSLTLTLTQLSMQQEVTAVKPSFPMQQIEQ